MKNNPLNTNGLPTFMAGNGKDAKAATEAVVRWLEENSLLSPSSNKKFYEAFEKYQKGEAKITDFPILVYLSTYRENSEEIIPSNALQVFIDAGANVNARDPHKSTPLHWASDGDAVKALIEAGADVNAGDRYGSTPLHWASDGDTVKALIEAGADVNVRDEAGRTPLHGAKNVEAVKALIAGGADVNVRDRTGYTPLRYAREARQENVVRALLDAGAGE